MRRRWQQIRYRNKAKERPFGTVLLDTVCEIKQVGKLVSECASRDTKIWFGIMARMAKENTNNYVTKNLADEFLRGLGEEV